MLEVSACYSVRGTYSMVKRVRHTGSQRRSAAGLANSIRAGLAGARPFGPIINKSHSAIFGARTTPSP